MRIFRAATACVLAVALSSCATLSSKSVGSWGRPYSGVRCVGTEDFWGPLSQALRATQLIYSGVDYLFSFAADTALLPVDLITAGVEAGLGTGKAVGMSGRRAPLCNDFSAPPPS